MHNHSLNNHKKVPMFFCLEPLCFEEISGIIYKGRDGEFKSDKCRSLFLHDWGNTYENNPRKYLGPKCYLFYLSTPEIAV
jgi:hypothetical protein